MKKQHNTYKFRLAAILTIVSTLSASDQNDWANLRTLHPGDPVGVVLADQRRIEGTFGGATDSEIVINSKSAVALSQANVVRVYKQGMSRKKRMLIGAAVGLAAGATVAATVSQRLNNEGFFSGPSGGAGAAAAVAGGAGIGLAAGSLSGNGYKTIYQKKEGN